MPQDKRPLITLFIGILLLFLGFSGYALVSSLGAQLFMFLVWAYSFLADSASHHLNRTSLVLDQPQELLILALGSVVLAAVAELFNQWYGWWRYSGYEGMGLSACAGILMGWAGLLPSLFITSDLLYGLGFARDLATPRFRVTKVVVYLFYASALACAVLLLTKYPGFPALLLLIPFLLAEPYNFSLGLSSLLRDISWGMPGKMVRIAAAGLIGGLVWNAMNSVSGVKWFFPVTEGGYQVFGLSLIQYPLYPVLALSAYSVYSAFSVFRGAKTWERGSWVLRGPGPGTGARVIAITGLLAIVIGAILTVVRAAGLRY